MREILPADDPETCGCTILERRRKNAAVNVLRGRLGEVFLHSATDSHNPAIFGDIGLLDLPSRGLNFVFLHLE